MKIDRSLMKSLALALSLPSAILSIGYSTHLLVARGIVSKSLAFSIFLAIVVNILLLMVVYAFKKKNKPK